MMSKNKEVQRISFENNNEKQLKSRLIEVANEYGFDKAYSFLAIHNQLILNSCNIDENAFYQLLFKNYIYYLNSQEKLNLNKLSKNNQETIKMFDNCIENNNFIDAFKIFSTNCIIYQLLCSLYIKNLNKTENSKINEVATEDLEDVYTKLSLLENTSLNIKREKVRVYQKVSSK